MHSTRCALTSLALVVVTLSACGGGSSGSGSAASPAPGSGAGGTAGAPSTAVLPLDPGSSAPVSLSPGTAAADGGADLVTTLPEARVLLAGSAQGVSAQWSQVSGPATAVLKNAGSPQTWVAAYTPGDYVFRLSARDTTGTERSDEVKLSVRPNARALDASSTALEHLSRQVAPAFKTGHTLLPLTMAYGCLGTSLQQEAGKRWGYAYQFPMYGSRTREPAAYWNGNAGNTLALIQDIRATPGRYKVAAGNGSLYALFENHQGKDPSLPVLDPSTWLRDASGNFILNGANPIVSPLARDDQMFLAGEFVGNTLAALEEATNQSVDVYLNNGEYGLWFPGDNDYAAYFGRDPRVTQAFQQSGLASWPDFISRHKARHERQLKLGIYKNVKKAPAYSWYQESYNGQRGRWAGWAWWMFTYEHFFGPNREPLVSDHAQPETYFLSGNSGWTGMQGQQGLPWDALTVALKDVGGSISLGQRHFYPWMSMGWEGSGQAISDDQRYMGMLKMWYASGALGTVAGYFNYAEPLCGNLRTNAVIGAQAPVHLRQLMLQGQAHALFSHLEEYLRRGEMLPGPDVHPYSSFSARTPAMEFPVDGESRSVEGPYGSVRLPTARLLARKIPGEDRWLLAVWANTGEERVVTASVDPKLGKLSLTAPAAGAVYLARLVDGQPRLTRVDVDPMRPTDALFP